MDINEFRTFMTERMKDIEADNFSEHDTILPVLKKIFEGESKPISMADLKEKSIVNMKLVENKPHFEKMVKILNEVNVFQEEQLDDMTLVIIKKLSDEK